MAETTIWWLLAGAAVAVELLTGTFYLLMVAVGLAAGALTAHAGADPTLQLVVAAVVGSGAVVLWHLLRDRDRDGGPGAAAGNLDIGETVHVDLWHPDGTATVRYRGAQWKVSSVTGAPQGTGAHRVREVVGSRLVVEKI
jgi:membrane protein implicated in regulation of membrane protease activity